MSSESWERIQEQILAWIPPNVDREEALAGVKSALSQPQDLTRPIEKAIGGPEYYAFRREDASLIELCLRVVGEIAAAGYAGPVMLGVAAKELVDFLIKMRRARVELTDPVQIAVLLRLKDASPLGLTTSQLLDACHRDPACRRFTETDVETALSALGQAITGAGEDTRLIVRSGPRWRTLV